MAKQLKSADLRGKTQDELQAVIMEQRKAQMDMRFDAAQGKVTDTSAMRAARRTVARAKTLQTETAFGINANVKAKPAKTAKAKPVAQAKTTTRTKKKEG